MLPQMDLRNQVGQDPLIQYLNSVGMPVTRQNYLNLVSGRNTGDDSGVRGGFTGTPETRRSRIRATPSSERQRQAQQNDRDIAQAQLNIRYDNLTGLLAKGLKIIPEKLLFGRTRASCTR